MLGAVASGDAYGHDRAKMPNLTAASLARQSGRRRARCRDRSDIRSPMPNYQAMSLAPFVYARPDTVGRFTDVPLLMWYETELTARGTRYRYSVVFSNEDGGTPADRLMATWGRTTDIEYVYSVEVDANDAILSEDMQGPKHEILAVQGQTRRAASVVVGEYREQHGAGSRHHDGSLCARTHGRGFEGCLARSRDGRQRVDLRGDDEGADARREDRGRCADRTGHDSRSAALRLPRRVRRGRQQRHRRQRERRRRMVVVRSRRDGVPHCARRLFSRRDSAARHGERERRARRARAGLSRGRTNPPTRRHVSRA